MKRLLALSLLLILVPVSAHEAPAAKDQDVRLLHDCVDDFFGSDSFSGNGYDLHTLDLREIHDADLGNALVFRLVLNGQGDADIDVTYKVGGAAKTHTFTKGSSWTGTFDEVNLPNDVNDGDRFSIEGTIAWSKIGAEKGSKISDYNAVGTYGNSEDSLRDYDGSFTSSCQEPNKKFPDGNQDGVPDAYTLKGPTQFFKSTIKESSVTLEEGQRKLIEIVVANKIRSNQNIELRATSGTHVDVEFHNIDSDVYEEVGRIAIRPKGGLGESKVLHVVVDGMTPGSGSIEVVSTSNLGGRVLGTLEYTVTGETQNPDPDPGPKDEPTNDTPFPLVLVLAALYLARRK